MIRLRAFVPVFAYVLLAPAVTLWAQGLTVGGRPFVPSFEIGSNVRNFDAPAVYEMNPALSGEGLTAAPIGLARRNACYGTDDNHVIKVFGQVLNMPSVIKLDLITATDSCLPTISVSKGQYVDRFEPGNGAHHIAMAAWTARGRSKMQGVVRYESDDAFGICGGAVVGLLNADGRLLHYYTPPTGCVNGKIGGRANQRFVAWEDSIPAAIRNQIRTVRVQPMFTEGTDKIPWEILTRSVASVAEKAAKVVSILGAAGIL